ncbi:Not1 N-terminal domain CCR4-Not complex component/NOT2 / NOT3 / NOT5 family [Lotmaria passim]
MSNIKKVQTEADRLLKKVNEGLEAYDELHEKLENAPNASAKERLEGDLKRELKKLQRHREAMKAFMQNDDYKEKTKMQQSRKRIEERMESFRAIEREMKTKAFSNEGLASAAFEKAESPTEQWLKEVIDEGRKKMEVLEYEAQKANNGRVRRGKTQQKSDYQLRLEKLQVHFYKWEALLRMVINEEVDTDEVDELQEPIQKVLEDDADMEVIENMSIYDTFDIAEPRVKATMPFDMNVNDKATSSKTTTKAKTPLSTVQTKASPSLTSPKDAAAASAKPAPAQAPAPAAAATALASPPSASAASSTAPAAGTAAPSSMRPSSSSPLERETAAVAAAGAEEEETVPEWMDDDVDAANDDTFGDDAMTGAGAGMTVGSLAEMASATSKVMKDFEKPPAPQPQKPAPPAEQKSVKLNDNGLTAEDKAKTSTPTPNAWEKRAAEQRAAELQNRQKAQQQQQQQQQTSESASPASLASPSAASVAAASPLPPMSAQASSSPTSTSFPVVAGGSSVPAVVIPSSQSESASPAPPLVSGGGGGPQFRYTTKRINELLDMSLGNLPHTLDVQRQRTYEPPNAIDPIPYFPQEVLPVLSSKTVYHQMDLDTLFFIFYYHQKSYQQYFAAKELKARSYRYHTKQQRWYQRLERPQSTTEVEERGAYTFFDFEDKWDHDKTDDFVFEYKYLENELN